MQSKNARKLLELSRLSADADDAPGWPIFHYYVTHTFGVKELKRIGKLLVKTIFIKDATFNSFRFLLSNCRD